MGARVAAGKGRCLVTERKVGDSYSIAPSKLQLLRDLAAKIGRPKAALIREGVDCVLVKYGMLKENGDMLEGGYRDRGRDSDTRGHL